jgi:hypothetical protein
MVGAATAATLAAASDEAPPSEAEVETDVSAEPAKAGLGAAATAAVAGAVVAGVAVLAAHEDKATPAETEAVPAAGPQVEIGPLEAPDPEGEPPSGPIAPAAVAVATAAAITTIADTQTAQDVEAVMPVAAAATAQAPQPESAAEMAQLPTPATAEAAPAVAAPKAEADAPKLSGLDALLIGLGRLALGQKPEKPAEAQPPVSDTAASVAAIAATDLDAELPADADAAPQEFTGKLPGADEAARIASEMSGGDPGKPAATE